MSRQIKHDALPSPHETTRGLPECCHCPKPVRWSERYNRWIHAVRPPPQSGGETTDD